MQIDYKSKTMYWFYYLEKLPVWSEETEMGKKNFLHVFLREYDSREFFNQAIKWRWRASFLAMAILGAYNCTCCSQRYFKKNSKY